MHRISYVCACALTISPSYTIFNKKQSTVSLNNIHQFKHILRIFVRTKACRDRQTNRMHKHLSTVLKSVKKGLMAQVSFFENIVNVIKFNKLYDPG